jgi:TorA maturation chaperone TorD
MSEPGETPALEPEDEARAAFYGLIAQLFYSAPDSGVLAQILNTSVFDDGDSGSLAQRWRDLTERSKTAFPALLEAEHTELFIGTGRAEVTPYLTHYLGPKSLDNPLVQLRKQLAEWGLARRERATEPEDHVSAVCEAMRVAIALQHRSLSEQKAFFDRFVYRGSAAFFAAVIASPKADFYRPVAQFAAEFVELEREAFDIA